MNPAADGKALLYGGPRDGAKFPASISGAEPPEVIGTASSGRYIRMDAMPGWMTFLPQRQMADTIYIWESAYVC